MRSAQTRVPDYPALARDIKSWGQALGFQQLGITDTALGDHEAHFLNWLTAGRHGEMEYMQRHGMRRCRPAELVPGTVRVISARLDYWPGSAAPAQPVLDDPARAFVSRYALGRDYHKLLRARLQRLADCITDRVGEFGYRVFTDSAPVLEKALAEKSGLGWIGKHTNLIDSKTGSWFFLGEIAPLLLPVDAGDQPLRQLRPLACPTGAIVAPV
jgi:epoxyqueuosine reductase